MRADVDFESYAAARWHPVVWTLVLLGVPPGHAATLAREALAQRRSEWSHQDAFDDLDAELYRAVLDRKHRDGAAWWAEPPIDDQLWTELEPELDRLTPAQREWLILRHVAELPESYAAAVIGEEPDLPRGVPTGERLRDVTRSVPIQQPDLEQVAAMAGSLRDRRRRRGLLGTLALLGLGGAVALVVALTAGDEPATSPSRPLDPVEVTRAATGAAIPWYAEGQLHLRFFVLDIPDLRDVASINNGAVYTDSEGDLIQVEDQGERSRLATIGLDGTFVASDEDGLVAWLAAEEDSTLVVRSLTARSDVLRVDVQGSGRVIAVDSGSVFVHDDRGDVEISIETEEVTRLDEAGLLDVASKVRIFQEAPTRIHVVQPLFDIEFAWPGERAQLSEDGNFALAWVGDEVAIYDTRSGDQLVPDLAPNSSVLAAEFGPDETITYLVLQRRSSSGTVDVRSCSLGLVYLPSGVPAPTCLEEPAGYYRGVDTDLLLAR